jgi:hypothetical protein
MHLFSEQRPPSLFWGLLLPRPRAHARQFHRACWGRVPSDRATVSGRDWAWSLHKPVSPGTPFLAPSRTCTLTTAHAIWRNRLEPPGYEPGGTHPRAHERVYGTQNTPMASSFERLIAAPCSMSTSDGVHVQTSDHLDRHPELLSRPSGVTSEMHLLNVLRPHSRSNGHFSLRHGTGCPQGGLRGRLVGGGNGVHCQEGEAHSTSWYYFCGEISPQIASFL